MLGLGEMAYLHGVLGEITKYLMHLILQETNKQKKRQKPKQNHALLSGECICSAADIARRCSVW